MYKMKNRVMNYAWGSYSVIQQLTGDKDTLGKPAAELWMGAHKSAPSELIISSPDVQPPKTQAMDKFIARSPKRTLGLNSKQFERKLPFLFKVLAAEKALSIQTHPSREQARFGYNQEERKRIPLHAEHRNYKDANHKPELLCALTNFSALCGFREYKQIIGLLQSYDLSRFLSSFAPFAEFPNERNLRALFGEILRINGEKKQAILDHIKLELDQIDLFFEHLPSSHCQSIDEEECRLVRSWLWILQEQFPDDMGILAPLLLNIVKLSPFEAIFLPTGVLHAYLNGAGLEIMANSDNVLRGGLTPKHIDVLELMDSVDFKEFKPKPVKQVSRDGLVWFATKVDDFKLAYADLEKQVDGISLPEGQPTIVFCLSGNAELETEDQTIVLKQGESAFITASDSKTNIKGQGRCFVATTGIS